MSTHEYTALQFRILELYLPILLTNTCENVFVQNEVALSYYKVRGLYFLAVAFAAIIV